MLLRSYQDLVKINLAVENGSIAQARSARAKPCNPSARIRPSCLPALRDATSRPDVHRVSHRADPVAGCRV